jgi:hypothetical protein
MSDGRDGRSEATRGSLPNEPRWPLLYGAVLTELVILIALFYAFTKAFS